MITRNNLVLITVAIGAFFLSMLSIYQIADLSRGDSPEERRLLRGGTLLQGLYLSS
jgi:hypothetical protein